MPTRPPSATLLNVTRPPDNWSCSPQVDSDRYADWDEVYSDNVMRLYRMMYVKVGNRPDAEDLTAEVFRATLRPLRLDASRSQVRGYLAATAQSALAAYWRPRIGAEATRIELAAALRFLDDPQTDSDAGARTERLLERLPERYRQILKLRFLDTLSVKEAAATMGVSVSGAKVLQYRVLRMAAQAKRVPATRQHMTSPQWDGVAGKRVVLTGGTNGIGLAAAEALAARGAQLAIVARDQTCGERAAARGSCRRPGAESHRGPAVGRPDFAGRGPPVGGLHRRPVPRGGRPCQQCGCHVQHRPAHWRRHRADLGS